ncbi:MAG: WG repeat-containing protein [Candidatus Cloacimonetes bacterium]|nr:WG repeat-containing protein [Candidatus Cloacimonadota bacterium]
MNTELELVQLKRLIEQDLNISFETDFNEDRKALCWKFNPELGYTSQAVVNSSGTIVHHSNSCYNMYERAFYLHDETQLTDLEIQRMKQKEGFENIQPFYNGIAIALDKNRQQFFIDMNGRRVSSSNFSKLHRFRHGLALVKLSTQQFNYLKSDGSLLLKDHLHYAEEFSCGLAVVMDSNSTSKYIIDPSGAKVSELYDDIESFSEGKALVLHNKERNFLDLNCNPMLPEWISGYTKVASFASDRCRMNRKSGRVNYVQENGQFLWDYDRKLIAAEDFIGGFALLGDNTSDGGKKYNFTKPNGDWLSQKWFRFAKSFQEGIALVQTLHRFNYLDHEGKLLLNKALLAAESFSNGLAAVKFIGKSRTYFINKKGEQVKHEPVLDAQNFINGRSLVLVSKNGNTKEKLYNYLTLDGKYLLKDHFSSRNLPQQFTEPSITINKDGNSFRYNWFGEDLSKV